MQEGMAGYHKSLVAEAEAHGLSGKMAEVYANSQVETMTNAINAKYSHPNIGGPRLPQVLSMPKLLGNTQQTEKQAIQEQARFYQEKFNAPSDRAQNLAERDVRLVKAAGGYGGRINYVAPVGQIHQKADDLEKHAQSSREQIFMGTSPGESERSGTTKQFAAGVHGEAAKAPYITGASLEGLNPEFMSKLKAMSEKYHQKTGKTIRVTDGFRTYQQQVELKNGPKGAMGATPGRSMHGYGKAVDIDKETANDLARLDLLEPHGLTRPMMSRAPGHKYEPWHVELGRSTSPEMDTGTLAKQATAAQVMVADGGQGKVDYQELKKRAGVK